MKMSRLVYIVALFAALMIGSSLTAFAHGTGLPHEHKDGKVVYLSGTSLTDRGHDAELSGLSAGTIHSESKGSIHSEGESSESHSPINPGAKQLKAFVKLSYAVLAMDDGDVKCKTCECFHSNHSQICIGECCC